MSFGTIIYIGSFELPDKNAAAHRVVANGKALRDIGYNVVFIGVNNSELEKNVNCEKELIFGFDSYKREKAKNTWQWFSYLTNIGPYKAIINKYQNVQAIIGYNLPALVLINLKKEARKKGIKIFSDCTEWYEIKKKGNSLPKFLIRYLDVYMRMQIINVKLDGVIAISSYLYNYYQKRGVRTVQIPPLVDTEEEKWRNNILQSPEKRQLLYAGTPFSQYKEPSYKDRIDEIIYSLHDLKKEGYGFQLHILGVEKTEVLNNFPELNLMLDYLQESIIFYGKLPHLKVIEILKTVDYSLFLRINSKSVKAGFPTKFVESVSCGIPVLTNKNSNIDDYLIEGINGFWMDMNTKTNLQESLKKALSITTDQINKMKKYCYNSKAFDYRNYIETFKFLLKN